MLGLQFLIRVSGRSLVPLPLAAFYIADPVFTPMPRVDVTATRSYSADSALVLRFLLRLRVLQHSVRAGMVAARDGRVWGHYGPGFHCAVGLHGRSGRRLVGGRRLAAALWYSDKISTPAVVCLRRAFNCRFGAGRSAPVGLGQSRAGTHGRPGPHFLGDILSGFRHVAGADSGALVR